MTRRNLLVTGAFAALPSFAPAQAQPSATLPKLPYATDALEPFIDARTMEIHHGKHHQAYVDNLNKALSTQPQLASQPLEKLLGNLNTVPESIRTAVRNNGGGHVNHSLFWQTLGKGKSRPGGRLQAAVNKAFGGQTGLEEKLRAAGLTVFGSGWVWVTPQGKDSLQIETSPNQDSPLMAGRTPLFGIDVWEHAYYLKYQNRRADYLAAVVQVINWDFLSQRYQELTK
ncbi:MAG: superoxide dismutase [Bryobacteraceae bacterium]|nr:superoxide dismutase [Bryobacteraceae bacterium]